SALADSLGAFASFARTAIDRATKLEDAVTADLFTEIARATDKQLWLVEAHTGPSERIKHRN
ncbi:MAG TPA: hypothetical protein VMF89_22385, partial [Polyangiales bacterium]|nr:hypothetical protein [Polyangiales bacterium]